MSWRQSWAQVINHVWLHASSLWHYFIYLHIISMTAEEFASSRSVCVFFFFNSYYNITKLNKWLHLWLHGRNLLCFNLHNTNIPAADSLSFCYAFVILMTKCRNRRQNLLHILKHFERRMTFYDIISSWRFINNVTEVYFIFFIFLYYFKTQRKIRLILNHDWLQWRFYLYFFHIITFC